MNSSKRSIDKAKIVIRYVESALDLMDWHSHNVWNGTAATFTSEARRMKNGSLPKREGMS